MKKPLRVALFGNTYQEKKTAYVAAVLHKLRAMGAEITIDAAFAQFITERVGIDTRGCCPTQRGDLQADLCISMGGDGTFLNTAAAVADRGIPILGINTGHLGFLADVSPEELDSALEAVHRGECVVEQRSVLKVETDGAPLTGYPYALNEVAVLKHDNSSLIEVRTHIDNAPLADYLADGLIVSTPTGSTGYSLSVGGPIIVPRSSSLCIAPVASHSLNTRPVIVCDDVTVRLEVHSRSHHFLVSIDGRSESFPSGTVLTLRRAPYTVGVMKVRHMNFFDTLRDKMMWGADRRK